ncbi:GGDEF domain-containing protein [Vampirovibrio sp.]|uniref:GGDEF domain-containing protein n=1 Tax=Vampirovibrio sp. TaxID=2717857 RepID=UPI003593113A
MKQAPDAIYIITASPARAEALKQTIVLRGFDEIVCLSLVEALRAFPPTPPALVIVDPEGEVRSLLALMELIPQGVKRLVLSDEFDEAVFLACHDAGARDFMVKPVPEAYLVSRVISTLQECRLEQISAQKDQILIEMGVISPRSGLLTTPHLLKQLKQMTEALSANASDGALSLLIVELEGCQNTNSETAEAALMAQVGALLKDSARGLDWVGEYFMDKYAIVLPQTGKRGATALGRRLLERFSDLSFLNAEGSMQKLRVRIGIAEYSGCRHYEDLLSQALQQLQLAPGENPGSLKPV